MSSRKPLVKPLTIGLRKVLSNTISPRKPLSTSTVHEPKSILLGKLEKRNRDLSSANSPNRLKDISNSITEHTLDMKTEPDMPFHKMSMVKLLTGKNRKDRSEKSESKKLREEIRALKEDNEEKDKTIKKLFEKNNDLQKEMQDMQLTVEEAKIKITNKLREYQERVKKLEMEVKSLKDENKTQSELIHKLTQESPNKSNFTSDFPEEDAEHYDTRSRQKENDFDHDIKALESENSTKLPCESSNNSIPSHHYESKKRERNPLSQTEKEPLNLSKTKILQLKIANAPISEKLKIVPNLNASNSILISLEKQAESTTNRGQRRITLNSLDEIYSSNRSDNHGIGNLRGTNFAAFRNPPSTKFVPEVRSKLTFRNETFESDSDDKTE